MGGPKIHLRAFTFVGVVILVSALMMGLFQEARAVEMEWSTAPETVRASGTFVLDIQIPVGERIPIESIEAIIEQQHPSRTGLTGEAGKLQAIEVAAARCPMGGVTASVCDAESLEFLVGPTDVVTQIEFVGAFSGSVSEANRIPEGYIGSASSCPATTTGYGYDGDPELDGLGLGTSSAFDDFGYGFGYGYNFHDRVSVDFGACTGYGYAFGTLFLRFNINVNGLGLSLGVPHYITVLAKTGSGVLGSFSSPFAEFTPLGGGGGGGGGGGPGGGEAEVCHECPFTLSAGTHVTVTALPAGFRELTLTLAQDCSNCKIVIQNKRSGGPGDPAAPEGFEVLFYFDIEVLDHNGAPVEGAVAEGTLVVALDTSELGDEGPAQLTLLRWTGTDWQVLATDGSSTPGGADAEGTLPGFSVFAMAADVQPPAIEGTAPTDSIAQVTPVISASWSDNRGIDTDSFELTVDDEVLDGTAGDLTVSATGFRYVPGTPLGLGSHTASASISDVSGLESTEAWSFDILSPECPEPPRIVSVRPADGATDVALGATIEVTVQEGSCAIATSTLTLNGAPVSASLANGRLTATLPATIGAGETVSASVEVQDTSGNTASDQWSFTTTQEGDGTTPPPDDDGGLSGLAWFLIILVVLAVIGAAAYFFMQKQEGGGA